LAYTSVGCNSDGVCKHQVVSQNLSAPVIAPNESLSVDIGAIESQAVRALVLTNGGINTLRITAVIIDATTGKIISDYSRIGPD
jgi:hypothetical protein